MIILLDNHRYSAMGYLKKFKKTPDGFRMTKKAAKTRTCTKS